MSARSLVAGCGQWASPRAESACKNLQAVPKHASTIGSGRPRRRTADPDFPGSAAMCLCCLPPVTPEAAGSSPVDPADYLSQFKAFTTVWRHPLARVAGGRGIANCKPGKFRTERASILPDGRVEDRRNTGSFLDGALSVPRPPAQMAGRRGATNRGHDPRRRAGSLVRPRDELTADCQSSAAFGG